jgi:hypothetical protein
VTIEGSILESRIAVLQREIDARNLTFHPHFWLSAEWFSPDAFPGGGGFPSTRPSAALERLERAQMLEVEGGNEAWCMKILRPRSRPAIDNAYKLRKAGSVSSCSARRTCSIRRIYTPSRTARASSCTSTAGTRKAIPMRTSRDVRGLARAGIGLAPALRRLAGAQEARIHGRLMKELARQADARAPPAQGGAAPQIRKTLRAHYDVSAAITASTPALLRSRSERLFSDAGIAGT